MPDSGYVEMWAVSNGLAKPATLYLSSEVVDDSRSRRFNDNKTKDASSDFFSKYQSDWLQNVKHDGCDEDGSSFEDDDSLSQKENEGNFSK